MRKQEWVDALVEEGYHYYFNLETGSVVNAFRYLIIKALDHPEFEPDGPVYTVVVHEPHNDLYYYSILEDGVKIDTSSGIFGTAEQAALAARAVIEVLNND